MAAGSKAHLDKPKFEADELMSLTTGAKNDRKFRKYVLPQRHQLLTRLQKKDQGCVFVQGLPYGITEQNLHQFMKQFGEIVRCKVYKCPKSGKTKGYGYVHFLHSNVAAVATKTMNNYFMLGHIIKCRLIPGRFIKDSYFTSKDVSFHARINKAISQNNKNRNEEREALLLKKRQKIARRQLQRLGGTLQAEDVPGLTQDVPLQTQVTAAEPASKTAKSKSPLQKSVKKTKLSTKVSIGKKKPLRKIREIEKFTVVPAVRAGTRDVPPVKKSAEKLARASKVSVKKITKPNKVKKSK